MLKSTIKIVNSFDGTGYCAVERTVKLFGITVYFEQKVLY